LRRNKERQQETDEQSKLTGGSEAKSAQTAAAGQMKEFNSRSSTHCLIVQLNERVIATMADRPTD